MIKNLLVIISIIFITNCNLNRIENNHGVHNLATKYQKLTINSSNKNDIYKLLGSPSSASNFDKNILFYIERRTTTNRLKSLGGKKLIINNILTLELDNKGMLVKKELINKETMNKINFSTKITDKQITKDSIIYNFVKKLKNKINDPLGQKK